MCIIESCDRTNYTRGMCGKHYQRWSKYGDPKIIRQCTLDMTLEDRFRHHGWTVTESGCWELNGVRDKNGYRHLTIRQKRFGAHRLAYELWVGPIPDGLIIRHKCDNPPCINPEHLEPGTYADNANDRKVRGRSNHPHGIRSGNVKLTPERVAEIREEYAVGLLTQTMLAEVYGVSQSRISSVVLYKTWA